jgi:hypothetical protein
MNRYLATLIDLFPACAEFNGTVIAIDAHVLKWTLDDNPPNELAQHHINEASFYGPKTRGK